MKKESFVYCWTDHATSKLYVGVHKGSVTDGYICSSKHFLKEYKLRPNDFTRQIIAEGEDKDMRMFESKLLQAANVSKCEHFYNCHENNGKFYWKGKRGSFSNQHLENLSESHKGLKQSTTTIEKRVLKLKGKKRTPDSLKKMSAAQKGKIIPEHQKNILSQKRKSRTDRFILASNAGKKSSQAYWNDTKRQEKFKEAMKLSWAKRKGLI